MSEPFLVRYGALFADQAKPGDAQHCFSTATAQIKVAAAHTFDPKTKLYFHAWNDAADGVWRGLAPPTRVPPPAGAATSPVLWSRAIGWYIAGIVDVLEYLPANHPDRPALLAILRNLAEGLRALPGSQDRPLVPGHRRAARVRCRRPAATPASAIGPRSPTGWRRRRARSSPTAWPRRCAWAICPRAIAAVARQGLGRREVARRHRRRRHGAHPRHGRRAQRRRHLQRVRQR